MKNLKYILIAIISSTIAFSCSNFEDINTNPDKPTQVASEMLATQVLKDTYRFWNPNPNDFISGNLFNKHIAVLETDPNANQYYYSFYPFGSFGAYSRLTDLQRMVEFAEGSPAQSSYRGLAKFMKAIYGLSSTLEMGDIPYSEAGLAEAGNVIPKYDKQADVFVQILDDLQEAESYFAEGNNFAGDFMFDGDASKWQKLCNAMQLKVLQTISKKITGGQKTRFAAIVNTGNLMEDNSDNLKLVYSENPNATHPFFNGENRRITTAISKLAADALKTMKDRRLFYFANPAQALIDGGMSESDFGAYEGALTSESSQTLATNNDNGQYSLLNDRYVIYMDGEPMLRFSYAEQCFIIAEGIEEDWVAGDAQEYYENGVKAMLQYYMDLSHTADHVHGMAIDLDYIENYFTDDAAYATGGTKEERLKQILTQRWLIDFFQGNGGNYPQFLRTGLPEYPLDPTTSLNPDNTSEYPKRWKYPESEQTTNPVNYQKAIDDQYNGFDGINQIPWYLQ